MESNLLDKSKSLIRLHMHTPNFMYSDVVPSVVLLNAVLGCPSDPRCLVEAATSVTFAGIPSLNYSSFTLLESAVGVPQLAQLPCQEFYIHNSD